MLGSSGVLRRQQFLIRSLGVRGCSDRNTITNQKAMQGIMKFTSRPSLEADAESVLRAITPTLDPNRYKGQAGKIAVIGGCREYTGAPYFSAISALKIGADLSHVFCTKDAASVIKSYSPELIVHPILEESYSVRDEDRSFISEKVLAEVDKWMERFDCLVVGPGLGRDPFLLDCVSNIMKHARRSNVPIVIDGDGLFLVTNCIDLVSGYPLAVLTPNINEYKRLVQKVLSCEVNDEDAPEQVLSLAKRIGGVTILRKGRSDLISDGETVGNTSKHRRNCWYGCLLAGGDDISCDTLDDCELGSLPYQQLLSIRCMKLVNSVSIYGSPRRCGGQGDILSGRQVLISEFDVGVFLSWARQKIKDGDLSTSSRNPALLGCIAASALMRKAASLAFENKKRSTLTTDIIECLGRSLEDICPVG
ncbi:hypothetical protein C1H46_024138 [Malus baccata]|uniref:ATP-dependent (S)-NAD(P)H-hydrate dehydratase n=1 Tax=Malus baccata TaxID=106549 RepID=A0A540LUY8_MALBA|nr:hypothetical protein C1H46_024138 [Malus baccata]